MADLSAIHNTEQTLHKMSQEYPQNPQESKRDGLFEFTMKKNWPKVLEVYRTDPMACEAMLTKSEETALHIAVASYHGQQTDADGHAKVVSQMVEVIPKEKRVEILKLKNDKGDTALHLAAALGSVPICQYIAEKDKELISIRNSKGETPLFLAAHHGKIDAFLLLHESYNVHKKEPPDDSLCRRTKDGDTILHSAISGEYFELAYLIIDYYEKLVNSFNEEGLSPLHILARKPNVFQSSSNLRVLDKFVYRWAIVQQLKKQTSKSLKISPCCGADTYYPENYKTCMNFFSLFAAAFRVIVPLGKDCGTGEPSSADEENPNNKDQEHGGKRFGSEDSFPPNYATCILLFKFFMNIALTIFGIGIWRIGKIKGKKEKHKWAVQIMTKLIKHESEYKYDHNGRTPTGEVEPMYAERFVPPPLPPQDHDNHPSKEIKTSRHFKEQEGGNESRQAMGITEMEGKKHASATKSKQAKRETPLLLAAKMGIIEMVNMILEAFPVAIQDLDVNEKNALLLAVENRQTEVYDLLMKMKLPEFVLYQVDDKGNSALHLAAKFQKHQPWRIPGAALQMQWEIKWYKHVKYTMPPQCFIQYNNKAETASEIFRETHKELVKDGNDWLIKTSESCSVIAALIATVAFATSSTVPGGVDQNDGHPLLENQPAFEVFSVGSIVALCFSVTALVFFLAILTSRCQQQDFRYNLPRKLLLGLSSLFTSIAAVLVSFCAGHFFILKDQLHVAALPIYTAACLPITFFAFAQLPLYFDLLWSITRKVPLRSYKVFYH